MKKVKLKSLFFLIPMILVFIGIFYIYYGHLVNTIDIIKSQYQATSHLIEKVFTMK